MARQNRLISIATAPIKAAQALGRAAERATSGKSESASLSKAVPLGGPDRQLDERMKQQAALRAARARSEGTLTPKGLARRDENKYKMKRSAL